MSRNTPQRFKASEEVLLILEDAKKKLDQSVDKLPGIYFVIDSNGKLYRKNSELKEILEVESSGDHSLNIFDHLKPEDLAVFKVNLERAAKRMGSLVHLEVPLQLPEEERTYALSFYAWEIENKEASLFFTVHGKDVTELRKVMIEKENLEREIKMAEQVQKIMLPEPKDQYKKMKLSCFYRSASDCGGDFLYYKRKDHHLKIWAGDVTGHGVGPAMISGGMRAAISIMDSSTEELDLLAEMNRLDQCLRDISKGAYWMTFQIVDFDFKANQVKLCQAGHTEVYVIEKKGIETKTWQDFTPLIIDKSHSLGMSDNPKFQYQEFILQPDSIYLSFSDGIYETYSPDQEPFGKRRLFNSLLASYKKGEELVQAQDQLLETLGVFRGQPVLEDDISIWSLSS